ncbi:histidinol-phosphatase HisJ family protein [Carnobacterium jeotgali]|uniref:histidinol-phosphatase HisJ family protein n=1 Tax=Carnobacterium jeotgali TaxID=545534 RepID=UPI003890FBC2
MNFMEYHHHTDNSFDSKAQMKDVCQQAINKGITEICFTEHFSVNPKAPTYGHMDFKRYFSQIEECRELFGSQLIIKAGIELCEPHLMKEDYQEALANLELDFILGSVHNIKEEKLRTFMVNKTKEEIYQDYFEEVYELVSQADIDVIAHLDLIKRYATESVGNYTFDKYKALIEKILLKAIERGIGIEINTSGLSKSGLIETFPSMAVLRLYRALGGEILTIGSDSHQAKTVGFNQEIALEMAKEAGFDKVYVFKKRLPSTISLN